MPDFLVIGAQKAGTTSMIRALRTHPRIDSAEFGELQYFTFRYTKGPAWYRLHFPLEAVQQRHRERHGWAPLAGEKSPQYLWHPRVPARAAALVPDAKLIALLREPVSRAVSQWHMNRRGGAEPLDLSEGLRLEAERTGPQLDLIRADVIEERHSMAARYSYAQRGLYAEQIDRWLEHFPREQLLILKAEDLFTEPATAYGRVFEFLGLPPHHGSFARENAAPRREPIPPEAEERLRAYYEQPNADLAERYGITWP